jgi:hypothetical protein
VGQIRWYILIGLGALSLLLCGVVVFVWLSMGVDCDVAYFWASSGSLICADTFDDAGYLTVREYGPWPTRLGFQACGGCVETGTEVPAFLRSGSSVRIWLDGVGNPTSRKSPGAVLSGNMRSSEIVRIPLAASFWVAAVVLSACVALGLYRRRLRRQRSREGRWLVWRRPSRHPGAVSGVRDNSRRDDGVTHALESRPLRPGPGSNGALRPRAAPLVCSQIP